MTAGAGSVAPLRMPPYIALQEEGREDRADDLGHDVAGTRRQGKLPRTAKASVTAGLRWAPEMVPMKKMTPMTIMPGARAFIGQRQVAAERGRADDAAAGGDEDQQERAPDLAEQAAVLELPSSNWASLARSRSVRRAIQARIGSPSGLFAAVMALPSWLTRRWLRAAHLRVADTPLVRVTKAASSRSFWSATRE